jgi:hypothetical protein
LDLPVLSLDVTLLLQEILEEIGEERQRVESGEEDQVESGGVDNGIVLVACKDECSCSLKIASCTALERLFDIFLSFVFLFYLLF